MCLCLVPQLRLTLAAPWAVALQTPLSVGFFRQEHWSGLPFLPPGDIFPQVVIAKQLNHLNCPHIVLLLSLVLIVTVFGKPKLTEFAARIFQPWKMWVSAGRSASKANLCGIVAFYYKNEEGVKYVGNASLLVGPRGGWRHGIKLPKTLLWDLGNCPRVKMVMWRAEAGSDGVASTALDHDGFKWRDSYIGAPTSQIWLVFYYTCW